MKKREPSVLRYCEICGAEMRVEVNRLASGRGRFCSHACMGKHLTAIHSGAGSSSWKGGEIARECETCGKTFSVARGEAVKGRGRFCSYACLGIYRRRPVLRTCETCGIVFTSTPYKVARGLGRWCSKPCRAVAQTTRPLITCDYCGVEFRQKSRKTALKHNFCSQTCFGAYYGDAMNATCAVCGAVCRVDAGRRQASRTGKFYCSRECMRLGRRTKPRVACAHCGQETLNQKYCSMACLSAANSVTVQCATCGIEMQRWKSKRAVGKGKYCSRACYQRSFAANGPWPIPTSKLERRVRKELDQRGIAYQTDVQIYPYWPDLLFPEQGLIVEIDGDYWHNRPGRPEQDQARDAALQAQGWRVLRIAEHAIKANLAASIDQIEAALSLR